MLLSTPAPQLTRHAIALPKGSFGVPAGPECPEQSIYRCPFLAAVNGSFVDLDTSAAVPAPDPHSAEMARLGPLLNVLLMPRCRLRVAQGLILQGMEALHAATTLAKPLERLTPSKGTSSQHAGNVPGLMVPVP